MKFTRFFTSSAGFLLLCCATAIVITRMTRAGRLDFVDPVLQAPHSYVFWGFSAVSLVVALICFFGRKTLHQVVWVAWLSLVGVAYLANCSFNGRPRGWVQLGAVPESFGISPSTAASIAGIAFAYLLAGSLGLLPWLLRRMREDAREAAVFLKVSCVRCGGHISFPPGNVGNTIACPHCQVSMVLHGKEFLKMECFFCKGHIEFPPHAVEEKLKCPHCRRDITLKDPAGLRGG